MRIRHGLGWLLVATIAASQFAAAFAGTAAGRFTVGATVTAACAISTTPARGAVAALPSRVAGAAERVTVSCTSASLSPSIHAGNASGPDGNIANEGATVYVTY